MVQGRAENIREARADISKRALLVKMSKEQTNNAKVLNTTLNYQANPGYVV